MCRVTTLNDATWPDIERLRESVGAKGASSVEAAAETFVGAFTAAFSDVALIRLFIVLPVARVPEREGAFAARFAAADPRFGPATRVLTLLGSRGREPAWNDRRLSRVYLTEKGRELVEALLPAHAQRVSDLLSSLDANERRELRRLLGKLRGSLLARAGLSDPAY